MSNPTQGKSIPQTAVRSYEQADHDEVARLYNDGLLAGQIAPNDSGADMDYIREAYFDNERHHFWVAVQDGHCVGMIGVASDEEHTAEIRRLRVKKGLQGTGIAAQLLETAIAHCKHHSYLKIRLDTRFEKDEAVDMFDKIGFQHTRTRPTPGKETLEFYLDLYRKDEEEDAG
ncbi:MAG: GNAT family N-acetyltransferase [Phycisphaeraceae bacterium]|nr:GNAT family N-acetyltransferase [Phycisphaeraceae bacterium]